MQSLWNDGAADGLVARVRLLTPGQKPQWGRLSCPQVVAHMSDACRLYLGELPAEAKISPIRYPPLKQLIVYVLPFPKNVPTAPELLARRPGDWQAEVDDLCKLIARLAAERQRAAEWPDHPAFGKLSPRAWGILAWRHKDHHLRQFGV
jgi:hypothetical protein